MKYFTKCYTYFCYLELKRRLSSSDLENEPDEDTVDSKDVKMIIKAEEQLNKIEKESSIAKVFAQNLEVNQINGRILHLLMSVFFCALGTE